MRSKRPRNITGSQTAVITARLAAIQPKHNGDARLEIKTSLAVANMGGTNMAKTPAKHGQSWTATDEIQLKKLAKGNTPTGLIAYKLERTEDAIRSKASEIDISLKPVNQSPYNRRKS